MLDHIQNFAPEFYGSVTVGERGQVSIPAKVRKDMGIEASTKLLVFSGKEKNAVLFVKADSLTELLSNASEIITKYKEILSKDDIDQ